LVDPEFVVAVVVGAFAVFGVVFHACASAACEVIEGGTIILSATHSQGYKVGDSGGFEVFGGHDVVELHSFGVVPVGGGGGPLEEVVGEFEHVVGVAGFCVGVAQALIEFFGFAEVFAHAVSTHGVGVVFDDFGPEVAGYGGVFGVVGDLEDFGGADCFGDVGIAVAAG